MVPSSKLISAPIFYGKRPWPGGPSIQQNWSLSNSMILYIAKNPSSSKLYQKLVQICKFFFETNPIIIVSTLTRLKNSTKYLIFQNEHDLHIQERIQNCIPTVVQKNFRFDRLTLAVEDNDIIFDDLKVLVSFAKSVYLLGNSIKYKNGTIVMLDKILGCLPTNIETFWFDFGKDVSMVNDSTMNNILKL
uniref:Uncharacterized protein n=1 Tax=Panagrolaimus sp. PS1159 TaxID=55785 RepID=A0AC35FGR7_9BILA